MLHTGAAATVPSTIFVRPSAVCAEACSCVTILISLNLNAAMGIVCQQHGNVTQGMTARTEVTKLIANRATQPANLDAETEDVFRNPLFATPTMIAATAVMKRFAAR